MKPLITLFCLMSITLCCHAAPELSGYTADQLAALPNGKINTRNIALVGTYQVNQIYKNNTILNPASGKPGKFCVVLFDVGRRPFPKVGSYMDFTLADPAIVSEIEINHMCNPPTEIHLIIAHAKYAFGKPH